MVAMNVWPTDAADGSVATEARWRKMGRLWAPSGVAAGQGGEMVPTLAFPNLTVQAGACWVDGHYCELAGSQVLTVTANGLAVVRFDPAANTAELVYRDAVSVPAQSPTGTWELPIAQLIGSALKDVRGGLVLTVGQGLPRSESVQGYTAAPLGGSWPAPIDGTTEWMGNTFTPPPWAKRVHIALWMACIRPQDITSLFNLRGRVSCAPDLADQFGGFTAIMGNTSANYPTQIHWGGEGFACIPNKPFRYSILVQAGSGTLTANAGSKLSYQLIYTA